MKTLIILSLFITGCGKAHATDVHTQTIVLTDNSVIQVLVKQVKAPDDSACYILIQNNVVVGMSCK